MSERFPSCVAAAVLALAAALSPVVAGAAADVRVLIDVSGSMKQNDPANLRVPAMRLVSELLPVGTRAGVWLFAEGVEPLIAPSTVDDAWRRTARAELDRIHSRGLFTHIEAAIDAAAADWSREGPADERHIVLLTDGMVDVSKNPADSASSRERILGGQLERVRAHGARVHAVALSDNVDRELLEALTDTTGGLLERAEDAERLQRIFLHMLEQTAAPVTVPLEGKQFDIDASVSELTLLIFRNEGEAVLLFPPGGGEALAAISPPAGVAWRSEAGYDLITVADPAPGRWRFEGAEDPDNRAVIVTDLMLAMDPVPGSLLTSEVVDLNAWMTDHGERITRADLLELVAAEVAIESEGMGAVRGGLQLNAERGVFEGRLDGRALPADDYRLTITVDSGTFKRRINRRLRLNTDPVAVSYTEQPGETSNVTVEVSADEALILPGSLDGFVAVTDAAGLTRAFRLSPPVAGAARLEIPATVAGAHQFAPSLYFTTRHGRSLRLEPSPATFELAFPAAVEDVAAEPPPLAPEPPPFSWPGALGIIAVGNGVLGLGFLALWLLFGRAPEPVSEEVQTA